MEKEIIDMNKQPLLNTYINNMDMNEAVHMIESMIAKRKKGYVIPINVDVVIKIEQDKYLKEIVDKADMVLTDGMPLVWISKMYRRSVKTRVSGSDLVPALCERAEEKGYRIFIIGGKEGVARKAKQRLENQLPKINIVGTYAPLPGFENNEEELAEINSKISAVHPDLLIACFGCPKQEKWIYENYMKYDATVSICAGATVDFIAGNVKRAPKWMREHGVEWLYRFFQEPRRLFKRYFIDDMKILRLIWKYK